MRGEEDSLEWYEIAAEAIHDGEIEIPEWDKDVLLDELEHAILLRVQLEAYIESVRIAILKEPKKAAAVEG